jgi:alkanesulfonate monooxygenase SsuD/methylene tetrahydromethanopterin reductase-like flavin-dependent oxidoreductase (luciferase family)
MRAHPQFANLNGKPADQAFTRHELVEVNRLLPDFWYDEGAAIGTAKRCAERLMRFLEAGADELVLHGAAPKDMGPLTLELKRSLASQGAR